jgi:putative ABC transport system permease protein
VFAPGQQQYHYTITKDLIQRTKEIGIRKVLGASVTGVWQMLSKDFLVLVIISCFIATPIAYYFTHKWLQQFNYRANIP